MLEYPLLYYSESVSKRCVRFPVGRKDIGIIPERRLLEYATAVSEISHSYITSTGQSYFLRTNCNQLWLCRR